jgi:hypothetical protein
MKYYRCYLLTAEDHIASARVLKCVDDEDAKRQCREVVASNGRYAAAEVWDSARRLYRYPGYPEDVTRERQQASSSQIAQHRRKGQHADAVSAVHSREQRLEREAELRSGESGPSRRG